MPGKAQMGRPQVLSQLLVTVFGGKGKPFHIIFPHAEACIGHRLSFPSSCSIISLILSPMSNPSSVAVSGNTSSLKATG